MFQYVSFMQYDYELRFISANVQNVPLWLSHKQEDALATDVWLLEAVKTGIGLPVLMGECSTGEGRRQRNFRHRNDFVSLAVGTSVTSHSHVGMLAERS